MYLNRIFDTLITKFLQLFYKKIVHSTAYKINVYRFATGKYILKRQHKNEEASNV